MDSTKCKRQRRRKRPIVNRNTALALRVAVGVKKEWVKYPHMDPTLFVSMVASKVEDALDEMHAYIYIKHSTRSARDAGTASGSASTSERTS